jgi:predicted Zn-dependent peptidase
MKASGSAPAAELAEDFAGGRVRIIRRVTPSTSASCAMAFVGAGSWFDPPGQRGLGHLYEHAFFAGAGRYLTAVSVAEAISDLGCQFNAHTYREHSHYYISGPCTTADRALDILLTCYVAPHFNPLELRKQRTAMQNELRLYAGQRERRLRDLASRALYGPLLGASPLGDSADIATLTGDDLRWYAGHAAVPERVTIAIDGPAEAKSSADILGRHLGSLPECQPAPPVPVTYGERVNVHLALDSPLAFGALVVPGVSYDLSRREMYAMRLFHTVLGGGPTSRLLTLLRDRLGVSYQASTALEPHAATGALLAIFGCDARSLSRVVTSVYDLLRQAVDEPITPSELARAREINRGTHVRERETSVGRCKVSAHDLFRRGDLHSEQELFDLWADIGAEEVARAARRHLRLDDVRFVTVAPEPVRASLDALPFLSAAWESA